MSDSDHSTSTEARTDRVSERLSGEAESAKRSSAQALEAMADSLRQANEHLVIASLEANAREARTAEAHRQQTLFLSMLAHELRNPLAPISMSIELLGRISGTSPAIQNLHAVLARQTAHLTRLVADLLDATRITTGKIQVCKGPVLLSQLMAQAAETSQPQLNAQGQTLEFDLPAQAVWIDGDLVRLSQLFSNLILNATKFSPAQSVIHVTARLAGGIVVVSVRDDGIGIPLTVQSTVFDLFVQGPVSEGKLTSGLGIGLSLVRTIAELHGGTAEVMSEGLGRGSTFTITLPATARPDTLPAAPAEEAMAGHPAQPVAPSARRILLIDDNDDINQTMSDFLVEAGHLVECAQDGATGLQMASLRRHDVICCDIGMPGMDGYEVARQLRARRCGAHLVAISGFGQPAHRDQALVAGFDQYLVKPVWGPALLELIDQLPASERG